MGFKKTNENLERFKTIEIYHKNIYILKKKLFRIILFIYFIEWVFCSFTPDVVKSFFLFSNLLSSTKKKKLLKS